MGQSKEIYETTLPVLSSQRTELRRELDWTVFMTEKYNTSNNQSLDSVITETSLKDINIPNEK